MLGTVADRDEIKARWGYSELFSPRFATNFQSHPLSSGIRDKVRNKDPFAALDRAERGELVKMVTAGPRSGLVAALDSAQTYRCVALTKEQLGQLWAIPAFDPNGKKHIIPYLSFLAGARPGNEPDDPRAVADKVPTTQPFVQTEAGIIGFLETVPVLLDGYCRSVLFMRSENVFAMYLAWVPATDNPT